LKYSFVLHVLERNSSVNKGGTEKRSVVQTRS
jgi:hypothetical protein